MTTKMKIAVPVTNTGIIDNHFGHCDSYDIFSVTEENKIAGIENIKSVQGCGCKSNIAQVLAQSGVTAMLAGGIGNGAINVLNANGIAVIKGCSGMAQLVVKQYLAGEISDSGEVCQHHDHDHTCSH